MSWQVINNIIWGADESGNPVNVLKPSDSFITTGWPVAEPIRPYANWIEYLMMSNLAHLETDGLPQWQSTVTYGQFGVVRYGGEWYISLQNSNTNQVPTSTLGSWWDRFADFVGTPTGGGATTEETISAYNAAYMYPHPVYNTGTTINLVGDNILTTDKVIYPLDTNPLQITVGTLSTLVWYYVYVDIPGTGTVVSSDVSVITTPPTWDPDLRMMVNGTKRCIGYLEGAQSGSGQIEPFITGDGWYTRLNDKRRILLSEPAPYENLTVSAGMPNMGGVNGLAEFTAFSFDLDTAAMNHISAAGVTGDINTNGLSDSSVTQLANIGYGGNNVSGQSFVGASENGNIGRAHSLTDTSGNIIVTGHYTLSTRDDSLAIWLNKFKLPSGVYS